MNENEAETPAPPAGARPSRFVRRERAACDALRGYLRDVYEDRFGARPPSAADVDMVLRLKVRPGEDWRLEFDPPLAEQAGLQLEESQAGRQVYRAGRVYCFRCDTSDCEHAAPPSPLTVFQGYAPNGLPEWQELAQAFLAAGDERVDQLYEPGAGPLALYQPGRLLKGRQLASFGRSSRTYAVLGQVAAGYFNLPAEAREAPPPRLAVTFQAVEGRSATGEASLKLNLLAGASSGLSLSDRLASGWQPAVYRAWKAAELELQRVEQAAREAQAARDSEKMRLALQRVPAVLRRLAESLERGGRQEHRRTRHVERRRQQQRPVHKALEDARAAGPGRVMADEKAGTTVAFGPRCRAHVFNEAGRHVTSFTVRPQEIDARLRSHRWRALTPAEVEEFKQRVAQYVPPQKDKGPPLSL